MALHSNPSQINVLLNIISSHPRKLVPFRPVQYSKYFSRHTVKPARLIYDKHGDVSIVMVDKEQALTYLKNAHGFYSRADIDKELEDARSNL